jgi:hypothetical protein
MWVTHSSATPRRDLRSPFDVRNPPHGFVPNGLSHLLVPDGFLSLGKMWTPGPAKLVPKCLHRQWRERHFRRTVTVLRIGNPNDNILHIDMLLFHRVFGDDPNRISQMFRSMELDHLLFGPSHVMRPKQTTDRNGKLDTRTRIYWQEVFPHRHIQRAPQHPKLLMYRCGFKDSQLSKAILRLNVGKPF